MHRGYREHEKYTEIIGKIWATCAFPVVKDSKRLAANLSRDTR